MSTKYFEIRRQKREVDTNIGGVAITSTSIEYRHIDLRNLRGEDALKIGGKAVEANYQGFLSKDANIRERDTLDPVDTSATEYEVLFVEDAMEDHIEIFVKRKNPI